MYCLTPWIRSKGAGRKRKTPPGLCAGRGFFAGYLRPVLFGIGRFSQYLRLCSVSRSSWPSSGISYTGGLCGHSLSSISTSSQQNLTLVKALAISQSPMGAQWISCPVFALTVAPPEIRRSPQVLLRTSIFAIRFRPCPWDFFRQLARRDVLVLALFTRLACRAICEVGFALGWIRAAAVRRLLLNRPGLG